jgi:transposase
MDGEFVRTFLALPLGMRRQEVVLHGHEQTCTRCGRTLREPIPFARGKQRHIKALAVYIVALCQIAPIKHVAEILGLGWDLVKEVFKGDLARRLKQRSLREVRVIAIDEFAIHKGHRYMTVVLDLETGQILWAAQGRDAGALIPFFRRLQQAGAHLEAVALDMWPAYLLAVQTVFPHVTVVHDPFHIVALANRAIDETRRELLHAVDIPARRVIKGSRFLLLRGAENLTEPARNRLDDLMALNEPLYQAYLLKEDLRQLWHQPSVDAAGAFLSGWIQRAEATGLHHFRKLAATLKSHALQVLSWFRFPISTGPLEGMNNKIKVLKRQAYGFRDLDYFKLRLYFIHESTPAFPG